MNRRKILIVALQAAIVIAVLSAFGAVGFLEYSAQPGFCDNCHIMEPYYQSWLSSSHNQVPCIKCHYAPGIKAEAMGKVQAANQVVKYITRAYGEKPWAEIEDAACTREGCHLQQELRIVSFRGVLFDHAEHLTELRRGKQLRCTSCHSQIVQGEHLTVTVSSCALCHFKDRPVGQPLGGCLGCHSNPPNVEHDGVPIDHEQIVRDHVSCSKCHADVVVGDGAASEERCWTCHNLPDRVAEFENTTMIHRTHIGEHNVECQQCHTTIQHKIVALEESVELECANCHTGAHRAQQELFTGSGGHGTEDAPSRMFLARVTCESCHALPGEIPGHEGVSQAGEATCLSCHGVQYADMLSGWQETMADRLSQVTRVVAGVRAAVGRSPRQPADSLIRAAEENVELVRVGKGAHNVQYADQLLRAAVRMAREAAVVGGANPSLASVNLGRPLNETGCASCHFGVEARDPLRFQGRRFEHESHLVGAGMECAACHTPFSEHGGVTLQSTASCDGCHHLSESPEACAVCHEVSPSQPFPVATGAYVHAPHDAFPCAQCHQAPSMSVEEDACMTCHMLHHTPTTNCLACHGPETKDRHPAGIHSFGCQTCHTSPDLQMINAWSRQVCTVCHQDRVEHNAPHPCEGCHTMPPFGGGGG